MNILASYNWLKEYVKTDASPEKFAEELTAKSMPVEAIISLKEKFDGMVIGFVKEVNAHPDADKLKVATVDIGKKDVKIVCGGVNLTEDQRVFVALPGAKVKWHGEGDLVELKETKIRGVESYGMICAPEEVGFEKVICPEHGIWDLTELTDAAPGTSISEAFGLDDILFDIEITTNRPDAMGIVGLAREAAVATDSSFTFDIPQLPESGEGKNLEIRIEDEDLCSRYMGVVMDGVKVGPSPLWLQMKLLMAGFKPINNIVDITNLILHEYGRPMHAFDYEKLEGAEITVRRAKKDEPFLALDDNGYKLSEDQLVIADKKQAVAVAGVMGGKESGVWDGTTTIMLEAAAFDPVSVRRTARALNLYSDSQLLFEKGLSAKSPEIGMARAIQLVQEIAGGHVASEIIDVKKGEYEALVFPFRPQRAREIIGIAIPDEEMIGYLEKLGFTVEGSGESYQVTVPYWRDHDIEGEIDFTEEVARMYGYHNMPAELPDSPPPAYAGDADLLFEEWLKKGMNCLGYTEFYGYSFIGESEMEKFGIDPDSAVKLLNPLSAELTHLRTSLIPSILRDIEMNQGEVPQARVFELSRVYEKQDGDLPNEVSHLVVGRYGFEDSEQQFYKLKGVLEALEQQIGLAFELKRYQGNRNWHPQRTAEIYLDGEIVGILGLIDEGLKERFGIKSDVAILQMDLSKVIPKAHRSHTYVPIPDFPKVTRDISVLLDARVEFTDLEKEIISVSDLIRVVELKDIYRGEGVTEGKKSLTLSLTLRSDERTLESKEVDEIVEEIAGILKEKFNAELR